MMRKSKLTKANKQQLIISAVLIVLAVATITIVLAAVINLLPPRWGERRQQFTQVAAGSTLRQVARKLQSEGLIRNSFCFEWYIRLGGGQRAVKAGYYQLSPGLSALRIASLLRNGDITEVRVTIPEGFNNREAADLFAAKGLVDRERFLAVLADAAFLKETTGYTLPNAEGYLFPDTYNFRAGATEAEIAAVMLKRFKELVAKHFPGMPEWRLREVVILASLVEKEARKPAEREMIAGVFTNRLRQGYALQSCATVQYVLVKWKEKLYYKDLQIPSPYNTYLNTGLPPGPIANPGLASLRAAANPASFTYLYFVAKPDGSHHFSNTYAEHLQAQKMYGE
jgi:UPF0755 protein